MDYKRIIKDRTLRLKILSLFSFVPDESMLRFQYRIKTGRKLDLKNPKRFTEKLQWYKLYYRNPLMIRCVDKYDVRDYVKAKGLERILIPCLGVYDAAEQIDWDRLPNQFVMKDTLGGGGTSVAVVKDLRQEDREALQQKAESWVRRNNRSKGGGREWPYYSGKKHRIIFEQFISTPEGELADYKFFCFNGRVEFVYVMGGREIGNSVKVSIFDREFHKLPVRRVGDEEYPDAKRPGCYEDMIQIAEILSADFPHVRVDLYDWEGTVCFGELTFFNASGYMQYDPDAFDEEIGKKFELPDANA